MILGFHKNSSINGIGSTNTVVYDFDKKEIINTDEVKTIDLKNNKIFDINKYILPACLIGLAVVFLIKKTKKHL